jgi:2-furoyl-CoA dehydrogenase FAD binding subunit
MKAAPFRYERPRELVTALTLVRDPDAKALAGGQSLVPVMAMRLARPRVLVDLARVEGLGEIKQRDGELVTGAMVRQRMLEQQAELARQVPLLAAALPHVGHREIRNRGTVGGSVAHADPAAELSLVAATLQARIEAHSLEGTRELAGDDFARGPFQTALAPGELLTAIRWPMARPGDGFAFAEVARRHGDFALCGVAVHVRRSEEQITLARVGLMGVGPAPVVHDLSRVLAATAAERRTGDQITKGVETLARELAERVEPPSDMHASAGYRRRLVRVLVQRALLRALREAEE